MPAQVHLLGEPGRGAALEAGVVSRIKMVSRRSEMQQVRHAISSAISSAMAWGFAHRDGVAALGDAAGVHTQSVVWGRQ